MSLASGVSSSLEWVSEVEKTNVHFKTKRAVPFMATIMILDECIYNIHGDVCIIRKKPERLTRNVDAMIIFIFLIGYIRNP